MKNEQSLKHRNRNVAIFAIELKPFLKKKFAFFHIIDKTAVLDILR